MSYPPQDPYGSQSGPYSGQYPSGQYPTGGYPQQGGSDDFWRQVAGSQPQPPMPPQKKRTGLVLGLVGAGVAVVAVIVLVVVLSINAGNKKPEANPKPGGTVDTSRTSETTSEAGNAPITVGDCIGLLDQGGGEMTSETCGTPDSDYEVVKVSNGTNRDVCGDDYSNVIDGTTYCIVLDVVEGDCVTPYDAAEDRIPLKLDCSEAQDQITKVAPRGDPAVVCGPGDGYYNFADKMFCFNDVKGA
ncbi:hypothetical protein OU415_30375 [Saccharopolyspora sp. WRP15-2]|uniref:Uncharacterized protein n=1 Tax=Saccharopolyspora oryzae TaxID=2997343 RepID=A0ABT4V8Q0_9PSEU|nr:hypothetical protein [Saccharopolyspora oryzae]MDA3629769.1 hypothetical protein [Saccharopolyspora oryzae]